MLETHLAWKPYEPQTQGSLGGAICLPIGHHLPALVVQIPQALKAAHHGHPRAKIAMGLDLGASRIGAKQQHNQRQGQSQGLQQPTGQTGRENRQGRRSAPGMGCHWVWVAQRAQIAIALR